MSAVPPDAEHCEVTREVIGTVPQEYSRVVSACADDVSLWVEISGPKGGSPWQMNTTAASTLSRLLAEAVERVESA